MQRPWSCDARPGPIDFAKRADGAPLSTQWPIWLVGGALLFSTLGVKNWLARKDRASEITMDDLTAELRLHGLDPPYDAVKQELATRFAGMDEATQRKARRKFAREIGMFIRESDKSLHRTRVVPQAAIAGIKISQRSSLLP